MTATGLVTVSCTAAVADGARARQVCKIFGLSARPARRVLGSCRLEFRPGQITLVIGPSGSGKSLLLNAVARRLGKRAIRADGLALENQASVADSIPLPLEAALKLLSACGLGEARLMAAKPEELSEGERHRLRLAAAIARARRGQVILLDEFCATLDRLSAILLAHSVRRLADRMKLCLLLATTHQDLFEALDPEVVVMTLGGGIEVTRRKKVRGQSSVVRCREPEIRNTDNEQLTTDN